MKAVIQEEQTGCAIASSAAIAGLSYQDAKKMANSLGIFAEDASLWSDTKSIRTLLNSLGFSTSEQTDFKQWDLLADCALLSLNWHLEKGKPYWHWAVFVREEDQSYVLDSNASLENNIIYNYQKLDVKWFIPIAKVANHYIS